MERVSKALPWVLLFLAVVSSTYALTCHECSYTYYDDEVISDIFNCSDPDNSTSFICVTGEGEECYTSITTRSSGSIRVNRGCGIPSTSCEQCTGSNTRDCGTCCDSNRCNIIKLEEFSLENRIAQKCYTCEYSEVPSARQDEGCSLSGFDPFGSGVNSVLCPGLCYSAKARIPGLEGVVRGCDYYGSSCDLQRQSDGEDRQGIYNLRDSIDYEISCCTGENCNSATTASAGIKMITVPVLLGIRLFRI